ncbi:MAG: RDD family protein [Thermoanaerobaculia bacterium]
MSPEEISASYDSSIVIRRWLGTVIDFVVLAGIVAIPYFVLGERLWGYTLPLWGLLVALYYPLLEGLTGFTAGKLIARIKVVDEVGGLPGIKRALIRTLTRLIEVNPMLFGGIPAGVIVLSSKKRQRLGDMLAGTFVLKTSDLLRIASPAEVFA